MYVGKCMDNVQGIWMDESESQDQRWKRMVNARWNDGRYVWTGGRDGACPQCRVQVEEGKVNGWISESGRQWINERRREDSSI